MQTGLNLVLSCITSFPCTGMWVYKLRPVSGIKSFSKLLVSSNPMRNRSLLSKILLLSSLLSHALGNSGLIAFVIPL